MRRVMVAAMLGALAACSGSGSDPGSSSGSSGHTFAGTSGGIGTGTSGGGGTGTSGGGGTSGGTGTGGSSTGASSTGGGGTFSVNSVGRIISNDGASAVVTGANGIVAQGGGN